MTILINANFTSTNYTIYTCCKQLFARWVCSRETGRVWSCAMLPRTEVHEHLNRHFCCGVGRAALALTVPLSFQHGAREWDALLYGSLGQRGGQPAMPDRMLQALQPHTLHGMNPEIPPPGSTVVCTSWPQRQKNPQQLDRNHHAPCNQHP